LKIVVAKSPDEIIGPKRLTRFERARIISARALQLSMGAPPLIDVSKVSEKDPIVIAEMELEEGVLPITVARKIKGIKQLIPLKWLLEHRKEKQKEKLKSIAKK